MAICPETRKNTPCCGCKQLLPLSSYYRGADLDYHYMCKDCDKARRKKYYKEHGDLVRKQQKIYNEKNPDIGKCFKLRSTFGITLNEYKQKLEAQNNVCSICKSSDPGKKNAKYLAVDHDHSTRKIRGLLCGGCNKLIGFAKEKTEILEEAIQYLNYWRNKE